MQKHKETEQWSLRAEAEKSQGGWLQQVPYQTKL